MTVDYELTPDDYAAFAWAHYSASKEARADLRRLQYGLTLLFLAMFVIGRVLGPSPGDFVWLAIAGLWFLLMPRLHRAGARGNTRRMAEQGLWRGAVGQHRMTIDSNGMTDATPYYEHRTHWSGIERIVHLPERVLIYVGPNAALHVPRRAFQSDPTFDAFVSELQAGIATA